MANRSMQAKFERSRRQAIERGYVELSKPDYIANDMQDARHRDSALIASFPADKITKCEPAKAKGLHKDYGTTGKRGAHRATKCYGNGERKFATAEKYYNTFVGYNEPWVLFRPV